MAMSGTLASPEVTIEDFLTRGYFPDRVIPPVNSLSIQQAIPELLAYAANRAKETLKLTQEPGIPRSRPVIHSVPKRKHLRRLLSIPNPLIHSILATEIVADWETLVAHFAKSPLSLSSPIPSSTRAVESTVKLNDQAEYRARRSVGARYLLKADIAAFYPSIYTHSIPWALHTKAQARADKKYNLPGNRLDLWVRESQDKQTHGIPIGPDTSTVIGELIGTAIDASLVSKFPSLRGTRSIDDYHLYFATLSEAETAIAALHEAAREFDLAINDVKTEIVPLPDPLEPRWKSDLRGLEIRDAAGPQSTDLLTLFDRAFEYSRQFPTDSVLTYAAKQTLSAEIVEANWPFCEALLLKAALTEPTMISVLSEIYLKYGTFHKDSSQLSMLINNLCSYHAPLQQGNEVSWALWLAKQMNIAIPKSVGDKVARLDDDIVALISLDLSEQGLFTSSGFTRWRIHMNATELYDNHWLLAYEGLEHGWLPPTNGTDYVANDEFFSMLRSNGVRFYGEGVAPTSSFFPY